MAVILWDADAASELAPPLTAGQPPVLALVADLERSTALLTRGVAASFRGVAPVRAWRQVYEPFLQASWWCLAVASMLCCPGCPKP